MTGLIIGSDGVVRCWWCGDDPDYVAYHDHEWGRPVSDDHRLYEKLCLEGFQSGLSWLTILRKRAAFRTAFAEFDPYVVRNFGPDDVERLVSDAAIVRHRGKIVSTINNASRAIETIDEWGSLASYLCSFLDANAETTVPALLSDVPAMTLVSTAISRDLKRRGWTFVGPTTVYAFMQSMGMVNDHLEGCSARSQCAPFAC